MFTEENYAMPLQIMHMNKVTYDSLTDEQKEAVQKAAKAAETYGWDLLAERVKTNYETMRENGMTVVEDVSAEYIEALTKAGQQAMEDWKAKFPQADELLASYEKARGQQ